MALDITPENLILIAFFLLIGFPVHEFAHAFTAWRLGDSTAKLFGRLTLNPIAHFDPIGGLFLIISVLFGGFVIGWAKPTPVNTANLRDRRNGEVMVALAGPVSNWLLAIAATNAISRFENGPASETQTSPFRRSRRLDGLTGVGFAQPMTKPPTRTEMMSINPPRGSK